MWTRSYSLKEASRRLVVAQFNQLLIASSRNKALLRTSALCLAADSRDTQTVWLTAFENSGIQVLPEMEGLDEKIKNAKSIFEFEAKDIDGNNVKLGEKYRGHVTLVVNVASKCGLASKNYTQLVELHKEYAESNGLRILAFPCNQFGKQEPGSAEEIKAYASGYGVEFDMFSKVEVNGSMALPLYQYLKSQLKGSLGNFIKWNYAKFVCDADGVPFKRYSSTTAPLELVPDLLTLFSKNKN